MIDTKNIKLSVYAVLGEGNKLMFDIPQSMQESVDVKPGDIIDLDQLALWGEIDRAYQDHKHCKDPNKLVDLKLPAGTAKRLDIRSDGSVRLKVLLSLLQGKREREEVTLAERADLMGAIFNPNRAAKRKPGHK